MATTHQTAGKPLLTLAGVSKNFGGVHALRGVDFEVRAGEVHALVGENGAGKSTAMKVIAGNHIPNAGTIHLEGEQMHFRTPHDALVRGIALIHQETALAPDLTVAENVMICHLPGVIRWAAMYREASALIKGLGFDIDPSAPVSSLSAAHRQIVEIAKALSLQVKLLVLDEPTASLAPSDASRLLDIVRDLRKRGVGIVYISHRLHEVFEIADRITVLKDGEKVATVTPREVDMDGLIRLMVGRPLAALFPRREGVTIGKVVLKVSGLGRRGVVDDVSLEVRAGEVVGIGGLIGSGRTELVRMIFGADRADVGSVDVDGRDVTPTSTGAGVQAGIGLVPEDRKSQGAVLSMPIRINSTLARLSDVSNRLGALRLAHERHTVAGLMKSLQIKARDMDADVSTLSGGNQQKVVLAKWFHAQGRVIMLDEPTRGVDVGAKAEIYTLINTLRRAGHGDRRRVVGACRADGPVRPDPRHGRRPHAAGSSTRPSTARKRSSRCRSAIVRAQPSAFPVRRHGMKRSIPMNTESITGTTHLARAARPSFSWASLKQFNTVVIFAVLVIGSAMVSSDFMTGSERLQRLAPGGGHRRHVDGHAAGRADRRHRPVGRLGRGARQRRHLDADSGARARRSRSSPGWWRGLPAAWSTACWSPASS